VAVNREGRRAIPGPNYEGLQIVVLEGGPTYHMALPGRPQIGTPSCPPQSAYYQSRTPLVPTADEVAALPQLARVAFAERCALRVKPVLTAPDVTASDAARVIFETATIDSPLTAQLRCIRRDFVRLKRLAREQKWTDDTPVPPDVFGPMWPEGVEPYWAVEPPLAASPEAPAPPPAGN
jgi:hypothetical protein